MLPRFQFSREALESHKDLNHRFVAARVPGDVAVLLGAAGLARLNFVNAVTAFHRLAKVRSCNHVAWATAQRRGQLPPSSSPCLPACARRPQTAQRLPPAQQAELRRHPAVLELAAGLEADLAAGPALQDVQAMQLLWAHAHLGHATPALVDALYVRLDGAEVAAPRSGGSAKASSSVSKASDEKTEGGSSRGSGAAPPPLRLEGMSSTVNLCYALARLRRPAPALLDRLCAALLAAEEAEAPTEEEEEALLHLEMLPGWAVGRESAAEEEGEAGGEARSGASLSGSTRRRPPAGIRLAACDARALCLLAWSLAMLGRLRPTLLRRIVWHVRQWGLAELSLQSICHLLQAQALVSAASPGYRWDQRLADDVSAELVARWSDSSSSSSPAQAQHAAPSQQQQQQQGGWWRQREQAPLQPARPRAGVNEQDVSTLARCLAASWRQAAASSGTATGAAVAGRRGTCDAGRHCCGASGPPPGSPVLHWPLSPCADNKLKMAAAVQRHLGAAPARRGAADALAAAALQLAPRLSTRALSGARCAVPVPVPDARRSHTPLPLRLWRRHPLVPSCRPCLRPGPRLCIHGQLPCRAAGRARGARGCAGGAGGAGCAVSGGTGLGLCHAAVRPPAAV